MAVAAGSGLDTEVLRVLHGRDPCSIVPGIVSSSWSQQSLGELSQGSAAAHAEGVDLWFADLAAWTGWLPATDVTLLDAHESQRAAAITVTTLRAEFIASRALLRRVLGSALGQPPAHPVIIPGEHGKPALQQRGADPPLHFNLSHSRGGWLLAVTREGAIGVDLELRDRVPGAVRLAARVFTPAENAQFAAAALQGGACGDTAFLRGWTRKEALLKATGDGFSRPARALEVGLGTDPAAVVLPEVAAGGALVWTLAPPCRGQAAVALLCATDRLPPAVRTYRLVPPALR